MDLVVGLVSGQAMEEDGAGQVDGPTDTDLIGIGDDLFGEALVLVPGAHIINLIVRKEH